jgi:hypothetical protein
LALPLQAARFMPAEYTRVIYQAVPEDGATIDDVLKPEYWAHVAHKLKPGHRIEILAEDGSWFAEILVRDVGRVWAKVALLRHKEFDGPISNEAGSWADHLRIRHLVGPQKWRVERKSDGAVLRHGLETRDAAETWAKSHLQAMAA